VKQNKYDDPEFFARYSSMPRSIAGLAEASEWHAFRSLLPDLRDNRLLDLGCGLGWHCPLCARAAGPFVVGVDLSEKMLARARESTDDPAIEDIDFPADEFDVEHPIFTASGAGLALRAEMGSDCIGRVDDYQQVQLRISGMSWPYLLMYSLCSISLSRTAWRA
jgi:SAM-dependent methyltransferase